MDGWNVIPRDDEEEDDESMARRLQNEEQGLVGNDRPRPNALLSTLLDAMTVGFGQHMRQLPMGNRPQQRRGFLHHFQAYSPSVAGSLNVMLDHSDKILLPPSCLHELSERNLLSENTGAGPTLFRISSKQSDGTETVVHGGVLEFTAPDSCVVLPIWMMSHLHIDEGAMVAVKSCKLALGTRIRLRPVNYAEFKALPNPKALLERALSQNYFTLTKGTTITLGFQSNDYIFEVVETLPDDAISILNADVETDFDLPEDYFEPPAATAAMTEPAAPTPEPPAANKHPSSGRSLANVDEAGAPGNRLCDNCGKWVPELSYDRHVAFCERNMTRCNDCGARMPKADEKTHFESFHAPVTCVCGATCPKDMLQTHKEFECEKRMEICQFCELSFAVSELTSHSNVCGARTQRCSECGDYVMLQDMMKHKSSGCTYRSNKFGSQQETVYACTVCNSPFFSEAELSRHFDDTHTAEGIQRQVDRQKRETKTLLAEMNRKASNLFTCDECAVFFASASGLEAHNTLFHPKQDDDLLMMMEMGDDVHVLSVSDSDDEDDNNT